MVDPLEQVFRDEWGRVLASLIGFLGDFELAEDSSDDSEGRLRASYGDEKFERLVALKDNCTPTTSSR